MSPPGRRERSPLGPAPSFARCWSRRPGWAKIVTIKDGGEWDSGESLPSTRSCGPAGTGQERSEPELCHERAARDLERDRDGAAVFRAPAVRWGAGTEATRWPGALRDGETEARCRASQTPARRRCFPRSGPGLLAPRAAGWGCAGGTRAAHLSGDLSLRSAPRRCWPHLRVPLTTELQPQQDPAQRSHLAARSAATNQDFAPRSPRDRAGWGGGPQDSYTFTSRAAWAESSGPCEASARPRSSSTQPSRA